ncbi:hypothetical protein [uncultured Gammaproteobacteria bacterium]|nr:hypothetical protein [uncultured Gammaproteobacteria bacterium]
MNIRLNEDEVVYISTPNPNDTIPYKQISLSTLLNNSNKNVDVFNKGIFFEIYFNIDEKGGLIGIKILT